MATPLTDQLRSLGIRQRDDPILRRVAAQFVLPEEVGEAATVRHRLLGYVDELRKLYPFSKGVGIAAPQIGISRAMAVVSPPDDSPITLVNPAIVWFSEETDEQFEGCLSLFHLRGRVVRPLSIRVETVELDGSVRMLELDRGVARLTMHEIDHLAGTLYIDRVVGEDAVVTLDEYRGSESAWEY